MPAHTITVSFSVSGDDRRDAARRLLATLAPHQELVDGSSDVQAWWLPELGLQDIDGNDHEPMKLVRAVEYGRGLLARIKAYGASLEEPAPQVRTGLFGRTRVVIVR